MAINQIPRALLTRVGLKGEYRSSEQVKEHYEIEKALATRLRESSREERRTLYASLYDELFQRVPIDVVATGFHLKEYTNTELSNLFNQAGFSKVRVYAGALGMYMRCPLFLLRLLEGLLDRLPHRSGRVIARLSLLFNIRLVGVKK